MNNNASMPYRGTDIKVIKEEQQPNRIEMLSDDIQSIEDTLKERGGRYGRFEDNAEISQGFMRVLRAAPNYNLLTDMHIEIYHMIFHKIGRSVCGDPMYIDNIHDIIGYAKGLEDYLIEEDKKKCGK